MDNRGIGPGRSEGGGKAGVDLRRFLSVLGDLPAPGPQRLDELRDLKAQEGTIRDELKKLREVD
jgi:hypothetical protein